MELLKTSLGFLLKKTCINQEQCINISNKTPQCLDIFMTVEIIHQKFLKVVFHFINKFERNAKYNNETHTSLTSLNSLTK